MNIAETAAIINAISKGGLPAATASDVGKVLSVQEVQKKGAAILPAMSFSYADVDDNGTVLENSLFNTSLMTVGAKVIVEYNGETYESTISNNYIDIVSGTSAFLWEDDVSVTDFFFWDEDLQDGDPVTLAVYLAETAYEWAPGTWYDAVILLNHNLLQSATAAELKRGSYTTLAEKLIAGEPVNVRVAGVEITNGATYGRTLAVGDVFYDSYVEEGEDPVIRIYAASIRSTVAGFISSTSGGTTNIAVSFFADQSTNAKQVLREIDLYSDGTVVLI